MRTRYFFEKNDQKYIKATIYELEDHGVSKDKIDCKAREICAHLKNNGHEAYIVGGAVRDFLLNREPKDFDIATDASPRRVKNLFRNSRIIGKRFRLVHIFFNDGNFHEVATFRATKSSEGTHIFGTLAEDVMRRDFSVNALYYDLEEEIIIDFIKGVQDIRKKIIHSVLPLSTSFSEDPVRMLRAVKYAAMMGMDIASPVRKKIKKQAPLLAKVSTSRLSEELNKIIKSCNAETIFRLMDSHKLIAPMFPGFEKAFRKARGDTALKENFFLSLAKVDRLTNEKELVRGLALYHLTEHLLISVGAFDTIHSENPEYWEVVKKLKALIYPIIQPNRDVEHAVRIMFRKRNLPVPHKHRRRKRYSNLSKCKEEK